MRHCGVADPTELLPVELNLLASDQLIEVKRRLDRPYGKSVRLGYAVDVIGCDHGGHTRHVLHDDIGRARNMLWDELGHHACIEIINASRRSTGDKPNGFALVKGGLGWELLGPTEDGEEQYKSWQHNDSFSPWSRMLASAHVLIHQSPNNFFIRATTSGGVAMTSFARDSISSYQVGSISRRRFSASAKNAGSLSVF